MLFACPTKHVGYRLADYMLTYKKHHIGVPQSTKAKI